MTYPYYGYQPYPSYQPPVPDQLAQLRQQQQYQPPMQQAAQQPSIQWVSSERAAYDYLVAPNSAVALWDSTAPVVYLKQADASGKPSMKIYDLVERTAQAPEARPGVEYVTRQEFEALAARLDALAKDEEKEADAK